MITDEQLRILYDALHNSLDFGSGFLDEEEIGALRALAETIGIDPKDCTPETMICRFEPDRPEGCRCIDHYWRSANTDALRWGTKLPHPEEGTW